MAPSGNNNYYGNIRTHTLLDEKENGPEDRKDVCCRGEVVGHEHHQWWKIPGAPPEHQPREARAWSGRRIPRTQAEECQLGRISVGLKEHCRAPSPRTPPIESAKEGRQCVGDTDRRSVARTDIARESGRLEAALSSAAYR